MWTTRSRPSLQPTSRSGCRLCPTSPSSCGLIPACRRCRRSSRTTSRPGSRHNHRPDTADGSRRRRNCTGTAASRRAHPISVSHEASGTTGTTTMRPCATAGYTSGIHSRTRRPPARATTIGRCRRELPKSDSRRAHRATIETMQNEKGVSGGHRSVHLQAVIELAAVRLGPRHPACASPHRRLEHPNPRSYRSLRSGPQRRLHQSQHPPRPPHPPHPPPYLQTQGGLLALRLPQWPACAAHPACQTTHSARQGPPTPPRAACRPIPAWPACAPPPNHLQALQCGLTVKAVSARTWGRRPHPPQPAQARCSCAAWTSAQAATCGPCP
jgi:hypothetical protein